jgi:hypothetical protein
MDVTKTHEPAYHSPTWSSHPRFNHAQHVFSAKFSPEIVYLLEGFSIVEETVINTTSVEEEQTISNLLQRKNRY